MTDDPYHREQVYQAFLAEIQRHVLPVKPGRRKPIDTVTRKDGVYSHVKQMVARVEEWRKFLIL
ncbi:hypothetical protein [Virgibacillus pantothenticus]|uniref:hypothetical protein n=1 Tax=Virgibacillus pantothenticus TaxID=1473 RepID=UPI001BAFE225|nr:hypothetical protein [Virgibacillus pantothenticus]